MDRDKRWDRVQRAYDAMTRGEGVQNPDPVDAVQRSYDAGVTDEFVEPVVCTKDGKVKEGDSIIFINFRPDRAREITRCFVDPAFTDVERKKGYFPVTYVCTTEYDATMPNVLVAFPHRELTNIFGEYIARQGYTQLRIAETEKYAHVTFFFNGGAEQVFPGEDRCLIPSPKVATYDLQPEMSAPEVTEEAVKRIESGNYDVIILNFANCDMVGHTGVFEAAVKAVEAVDTGVGKVVEATSRMGGVSLITADHGNAERMLDADGTTPLHRPHHQPGALLYCGRRCQAAGRPPGRHRPHHVGSDGPGKARRDGWGDSDFELRAFPGPSPPQAGGAVRCPSVLADGQNLDVGAIHLPRADKKTRGPRAASRVGYLEKPAEMDGETLIVN